MMRYQRVSPDYLPITNGTNNKPLRQSPSTTPNEDISYGVPNGFQFRSTQQEQEEQEQDPSPSGRAGSRGTVRTTSSLRLDRIEPALPSGDVLLRWGQRKRSRISRSTTDDSSSSSGQGSKIQTNRVLRRSVNPSMPPPPTPPQPTVVSGRNRNLRNGNVGGKESSTRSLFTTRNLEDRSPSRNNSRSVGTKRSPPSSDQIEKRSSLRDHNQRQQNGFDHHHRVHRSETTAQIHQEMDAAITTQVEVVEWPRIYIALSRKEKEEDFLVMKGTKLPHRPKKRPKNIDKALQYGFPGMWLSDLTKNRYEVREKKNVKKQQKRRGLKGMENLESDSE